MASEGTVFFFYEKLAWAVRNYPAFVANREQTNGYCPSLELVQKYGGNGIPPEILPALKVN